MLWFLINAGIASDAATGANLNPGDGSLIQDFWNIDFQQLMGNSDIPGAMVSVVSSNHILFQKTFGLANVRTHSPMMRGKTLFRVASISKIFTAISILQLAEDGALDLRGDLNHYFDRIQIGSDWDQPVSAHHLLTHSSGFDINRLDYAETSRHALMPIQEYLIQALPRRLREPGRFANYDNYGYTMAGYLVQKLSGHSYPDYVRTEIFEPLGMDQSRFSLPDPISDNIARGYRRIDGEVEPIPRSFINIKPAAGILVSCDDMTRFLLALLHQQTDPGPSIFSSSVLQALFQTQQRFHPAVPGRSYGFNQVLVHGHPMLRQTGQWPGFNSVLLLAPDQQFGLFVAYNLNDRLLVARQTSRHFVGTFLEDSPESESAPPSPGSSDRIRDGLAGYYVSLRYPVDSPRLRRPQGVQVNRLSDRAVSVGGYEYHAFGTNGLQVTESPDIPQAFLGEQIGIKRNEQGTVTHLITQSGTYRTARWYESKKTRVLLPTIILFTLTTSLIYWALRLGVNFGSFRERILTEGLLKFLRHRQFSVISLAVAAGTACLILWFHASLTLQLLNFDPYTSFYGLPQSMKTLLQFPRFIVLLTLAVTATTSLGWMRCSWSLPIRCHHTLFATAAAAYCLGLHSRNYLIW